MGLAATALGRGNVDQGRYHLNRALWRFRAGIEPVFSRVDPALTEKVSRGLVHLSTATGLRTLDALTLYEALDELRQRFSQGPRANPWLDLKLALVQTAGIPRAVFFLLASALAFFPLYLIRLTFGGRNVYWNLLGLAFLLLFLPIVAEGLSYFGSLLAEYGGLPALGLLSNLSIGQGLVPYLAWGLTVFVVVALAGAGLRGIAAQFGLLRERGGRGDRHRDGGKARHHPHQRNHRGVGRGVLSTPPWLSPQGGPLRPPLARAGMRGLLQTGSRAHPVPPGPVRGGHGAPALGLDLQEADEPLPGAHQNPFPVHRLHHPRGPLPGLGAHS